MSAYSPNLTVFTDGASRSNPGHAACAYVIRGGTTPVTTYKQYLGPTTTNNAAEYHGMVMALRHLVRSVSTPPAPRAINIHSDSKLVVEQINGNWKVKDPSLAPLCRESQESVRALRAHGIDVAVQWIPRDQNSLADQLCNEALDGALRTT